jgi:hypothetical protein
VENLVRVAQPLTPSAASLLLTSRSEENNCKAANLRFAMSEFNKFTSHASHLLGSFGGLMTRSNVKQRPGLRQECLSKCHAISPKLLSLAPIARR